MFQATARALTKSVAYAQQWVGGALDARGRVLPEVP